MQSFRNNDALFNLTESIIEEKPASSKTEQRTEPKLEAKSKTKVEPKSQPEAEFDTEEVDPEPHRILLLSWNIDGLENMYLVERTNAVCSTIKK